MLADNFVAHRGWRQHYPENTLLALRQAIRAGAVNIELDVQLSADQDVFVFHDASLERLCQQPGMIWDYPADTLLSFRAGEAIRFGDQFANNPMCPLSEVVSLLQEFPKVTAFVELKAESIRHFNVSTVVAAVCQMLKPVAQQCVLISFELDALLLAKNQGWQRLGAVFDYWPDWQLASLAKLNPEVVYCDRNCIPTDADLRALPWPIVVYEVGTGVEAKTWFDRGASAVETYLIGELLQEFNLV